jgi:hypothetical protein
MVLEDEQRIRNEMNQNFQARMAHLSDEIKKRNKER